MKIRMTAYVSGSREGQPWPAPGGTIEVPEAEGAHLCAIGMAKPVADSGHIETAVVPAAGTEARPGLTTQTASALTPGGDRRHAPAPPAPDGPGTPRASGHPEDREDPGPGADTEVPPTGPAAAAKKTTAPARKAAPARKTAAAKKTAAKKTAAPAKKPEPTTTDDAPKGHAPASVPAADL